jgi:hypothetical protein
MYSFKIFSKLGALVLMCTKFASQSNPLFMRLLFTQTRQEKHNRSRKPRYSLQIKTRYPHYSLHIYQAQSDQNTVPILFSSYQDSVPRDYSLWIKPWYATTSQLNNAILITVPRREQKPQECRLTNTGNWETQVSLAFQSGQRNIDNTCYYGK